MTQGTIEREDYTTSQDRDTTAKQGREKLVHKTYSVLQEELEKEETAYPNEIF